jgi:hypothetical protein
MSQFTYKQTRLLRNYIPDTAVRAKLNFGETLIDGPDLQAVALALNLMNDQEREEFREQQDLADVRRDAAERAAARPHEVFNRG